MNVKTYSGIIYIDINCIKERERNTYSSMPYHFNTKLKRQHYESENHGLIRHEYFYFKDINYKIILIIITMIIMMINTIGS